MEKLGFVNTMKELLTKIQIFNKSDGKEPKDSVPEASLGPVFFWSTIIVV